MTVKGDTVLRRMYGTKREDARALFLRLKKSQ